MVSKERVMEIQILHRRGMSIRSIARECGVSRNTVRKYLRGDVVAEERQGGPGRPSSLEPYLDWLRRRVQGAAPIRLPATVLHREVSAMGYTGSVRSVQRAIAKLSPPPAAEPLVRFETPAGHQAQMDWGEYRLGGRRVYAFVGVLGYSRWLYVEYVDSMKAETLVACHQRMLADFGGVPREILYDNMKTVVTQRNAYGRGRHKFHGAIWDLAKTAGYRPRLCQPYRPRTKGKVERAVDYIATSFFHPLVTRLALDGRIPTLDELNAEARCWRRSIANVRVHGTTGERPIDRLAADQAAMNPYMGEAPDAALDDWVPLQWPRYPLQRSPREYDAILAEAAA